MGLSNYNVAAPKWEVDNSDFPYIKLKELVPDHEYPLFGMFISQDHGYGEGAVLITADYNINVPQRYVDIVKEMMSDPEVIEECNSGRGAFKYNTFESDKYHRTGYRLTFISYK